MSGLRRSSAIPAHNLFGLESGGAAPFLSFVWPFLLPLLGVSLSARQPQRLFLRSHCVSMWESPIFPIYASLSEHSFWISSVSSDCFVVQFFAVVPVCSPAFLSAAVPSPAHAPATVRSRFLCVSLGLHSRLHEFSCNITFAELLWGARQGDGTCSPAPDAVTWLRGRGHS